MLPSIVTRRRFLSLIAHNFGFSLSRPTVEPAHETERLTHGKVLGGGYPAFEQELFGLMLGAEAPIGDREPEKPGDGLVAADIGMMHEVETVQPSPERSEPRMLGR